MPNLDFLPGLKTKVGAAALTILGVYMLIDGNVESGLGFISMGLTAFGIRMAIGRQEVPPDMSDIIQGIANDLERIKTRKTFSPENPAVPSLPTDTGDYDPPQTIVR